MVSYGTTHSELKVAVHTGLHAVCTHRTNNSLPTPMWVKSKHTPSHPHTPLPPSVTPAVPCLQPPVLVLSIHQQPHALLAQLNHDNLVGFGVGCGVVCMLVAEQHTYDGV